MSLPFSLNPPRPTPPKAYGNPKSRRTHKRRSNSNMGQLTWYEAQWTVTANTLSVTASNLGMILTRPCRVLKVKGTVVTSTDSAGVCIFSMYDGQGQMSRTTPARLYNRQKPTSFSINAPRSTDFTIFPTGFKVVAASGPGYIVCLRVLVIYEQLSVLPTLGMIGPSSSDSESLLVRQDNEVEDFEELPPSVLAALRHLKLNQN